MRNLRRSQRGFLQYALPAIATIGSALIGGSGQKSSNKTNIQLGREQMAFQERMSNSAYQRARTDMEAAGFNPMLAYSQGGASSPVGSMPQVQNVGAAAVSSASSAMGMLQSFQQVQQSAAQAELLKAQTEKVKSETLSNDLHSARLTAETRGIAARYDLAEQERDYRSKEGYGGNLIRKKLEEARAAVSALQADRDKETFSADVAARKAKSQILNLEIPRMKSEAEFWDKAEDMPQWLKVMLQILNAGGSARSLMR